MGLTNSKLFLLAVAIPVNAGLIYFIVKSWSDSEGDDDARKHATSRQTVIEIPVPRKAVGSIIGRQGSKIKELQQVSGARMNFKDDSRDSKEGTRTMVISGSLETAQAAECLVRKFLADLPVIVQDEMMVPGSALGRIIGREGENVRQMSRSSNAKIFIDRTQEASRQKPKLITIHGTKEQIAMAKSLIQEKLVEEEEFRAKAAVSAANREKRNKTEGAKQITPRYREVSASNEDWNTHYDGAPGRVPDHNVIENAAFPSQPGRYVEVYVSAIASPGIFWVQLVNNTSLKLDELSTEMTRYFSNSGQYLSIDQVKVGDIIAAPFENDDTWYRAKVMEIKGTQLDLFYVDYGDSCYIDVSQCKSGGVDMFSLPCQAVECRLAGLKPATDEWTEAAFDTFEDLTFCAKWKVLVAVAEKFSGSTPHIVLIDTNTEQDININEEMVRRGFAVHDDC